MPGYIIVSARVAGFGNAKSVNARLGLTITVYSHRYNCINSNAA